MNQFDSFRLKQLIERQLQFNRGKNLFYSGDENKMDFITEIKNLRHELEVPDAETLNELIDYTLEQTLMEFCRVNQFYHFDRSARKELKNIYQVLIKELAAVTDADENTLVAASHYRRLQQWLEKSNPFAAKMYSEEESIAESRMCAEYSPDMQLNILGIDPESLIEPVLDIGCGTEARLVHFLAAKGINIQGIDRHVKNGTFTRQSDWLEFQFEPGCWGTIISHLGFSNHFVHQHHRADGDFVTYARKYMEILYSLTQGGAFFYAPDLPFIEMYLDRQFFHVEKMAGLNSRFYSSCIRRKFEK